MWPVGYKGRVCEKTVQRSGSVTVPVSYFRISILARITVAQLLVSLRCHMDMEIVEGLSFYPVGMLMTLAVITPQTKDTIRLWDTNTQDDRKIERIKPASPENDMELVLRSACNHQLTFIMAPIGFGLKLGTPCAGSGFRSAMSVAISASE